MLFRLITLAVVLGVASSVPSNIVEAYPSNEVVHKSDTLSLVIDIFNAVIGHKVTALNFAVQVIQWVVSNVFIIFFGMATALGFCKLTGKCSLDYVNYPSIVTLKSLLNPEHLDSAERFLITAVEKYSEIKGRRK